MKSGPTDQQTHSTSLARRTERFSVQSRKTCFGYQRFFRYQPCVPYICEAYTVIRAPPHNTLRSLVPLMAVRPSHKVRNVNDLFSLTLVYFLEYGTLTDVVSVTVTKVITLMCYYADSLEDSYDSAFCLYLLHSVSQIAHQLNIILIAIRTPDCMLNIFCKEFSWLKNIFSSSIL